MSEKIHISNIRNNREVINTEPMKIKRINKGTIKVFGERLKTFSQKLRKRQGCPFLSFSFNTILKVLPNAIRKKNK